MKKAELYDNWDRLIKCVDMNDWEGAKKVLQKSKGKRDLSKLVKKKKIITRNGKQVETTVYVLPDKAETSDQKKGTEPEQKENTSSKGLEKFQITVRTSAGETEYKTISGKPVLEEYAKKGVQCMLHENIDGDGTYTISDKRTGYALTGKMSTPKQAEQNLRENLEKHPDALDRLSKIPTVPERNNEKVQEKKVKKDKPPKEKKERTPKINSKNIDDHKIEIAKIREEHGIEYVISLAKTLGVEWKEHERPSLNYMRAAMALHKHLKAGGSLQVTKGQQDLKPLKKVTNVVVTKMPPRPERRDIDDFDTDEEYDKYIEKRNEFRKERRRIRDENKEAMEQMYEDYKKSATEFSTIEEARDWAVSELLADETMFDESLDLIFVNHFKRTYDFVQGRFPMLKHQIKHIWTAEYENKWMHEYRKDDFYNNLIAEGKSKKEAKDITDSVFHEYKESMSEGLVNAAGGWTIGTMYGKDFRNMIDAAVSNIQDGYLVKGNSSVDNILVHEFGHGVDAYFKSHDKEVTGYFTTERSRFLSELIQKYKDQLSTQTSEYALANRVELFAELFTDYMLNPEPTPMAQEFGEWLEQLSKKAQDEGLKFKGQPL